MGESLRFAHFYFFFQKIDIFIIEIKIIIEI